MLSANISHCEQRNSILVLVMCCACLLAVGVFYRFRTLCLRLTVAGLLSHLYVVQRMCFLLLHMEARPYLVGVDSELVDSWVVLGPVNKRTHTGVRVVNRLSRYHTSAGLGEKTPSSQGIGVCLCETVFLSKYSDEGLNSRGKLETRLPFFLTGGCSNPLVYFLLGFLHLCSR